MLTGQRRYRTGFRGKLILQVEIEGLKPDFSIVLHPGVDRMRKVTFWRDATTQDVTAFEKFSNEPGITTEMVRVRREILGLRPKSELEDTSQ